MTQKKTRAIVSIFAAAILGLAAMSMVSAGQSVTPRPKLQVTGSIALHERRPQDYLVIGLRLWRPGEGPVRNAKVMVNGILAPHWSPGDYSGGGNIGDIAPGMPLDLTISIDGRVVVTGRAVLATTARIIRPRTDELIDRRLARLVPVEWAFSSGSWIVDLKVRKLPEKATIFSQEGIRASRFDVPVGGFPPASEADIIVHTRYGEMTLTGDLTADSEVKLGYSTAQYVRTIN